MNAPADRRPRRKLRIAVSCVIPVVLGAWLALSDTGGWIISRVTHLGLSTPQPVQQAVRREARQFADLVPDSTDLEPVLEAIGNRRIVLLGEDASHTREFTLLETRLIMMLQRRLGFDVVGYEAPVWGCRLVDGAWDTLTAAEAARRFLPDLARDPYRLEQLEAISATRASARPMDLFGFDLTTFRQKTPADPIPLLVAALQDRSPALAESLATQGPDAVRILHNLYLGRVYGASPRIAEITALFTRVRDALAARPARQVDPSARRRDGEALLVAGDVVSECLLSRTGNRFRRFALRDSLMASQLMNATDGLYGERKVVVVVQTGRAVKARTRIRRTRLDRLVLLLTHPNSRHTFPPSMGEYLARRHGSQVYVLALLARHTRDRGRRGLQIVGRGAHLDSFGGEMRSTLLPDREMGTYLDLLHLSDPTLTVWAGNEHYLSDLGMEDVWLRPREQFDGVIVLRKADRSGS